MTNKKQNTKLATIEDNKELASYDNDSLFVQEIPKDAVVKSMSPLIRPLQFPTDKIAKGILTKFFQTEPSKGKKGLGFEIKPAGASIGIALPLVATLAQGLEVPRDCTLEQANKLPCVGKEVYIKRMPDKLKSKKGQDAWHFMVAVRN